MRETRLRVVCVCVQTKLLWNRLVLQYQLHNRVENLADILTRCSGLLQSKDDQSKKLKASLVTIQPESEL